MLGQVAARTQLSLHQNCLLQDRSRGRAAGLPRLLQDGKGCKSPWPGEGDPWFREANPTTGESSMLKSTGTCARHSIPLCSAPSAALAHSR